MQRGLAKFAVYRAIRLWDLLLRAIVCVEKKEDTEGTRGRDARERSKEGKRREETRWRTRMEGEDTNAVGGSWRRNDYRPRTHSLPAIILSTNAAKSIHRVSNLESGKYLSDTRFEY